MFGGYLLRSGNYTLPMEHMNIEGYSAKVNTLDEDSYTDNFGVLNRTVIQRIPIVQVELLPMTDAEFDAIMNGLRSNYIVNDERKSRVSAWVPEYGAYVEQDMYISDPEIAIQEVRGNSLIYKSVTLKFNGYGE